MIGETAQLITELLLKDNLSSGVASAESRLGGLNTTAGKTGVATAAASSGLGRLEGAASKVGGAMSHAAGQISGLISNIGLFGGIAGVAGLGAVVTSSVTKVEALGQATMRLQQVTGESAQSTSSLLAVGEKWGVSLDSLVGIAQMYEKTVGKLAETQAKATKAQKSAALQTLEDEKLRIQATGGKVTLIDKLITERKAQDALAATHAGVVASGNKLMAMQKQFGVVLTDSKGQALGFTQALTNVSAFYAQATTAAQKAVAADLAASVFGKGYKTLLPLLVLGKQGFAEATAEAQKFGLTLTDQNMEQFKQLLAVQHTWGDVFGGLQIQAGLTILPALTDIGTAANKYLGDPTNRASLLGALKSVENIAGQVGSAILTVGHAIASIWGMIPGPMQQLLIGGFVANKAAGWLFGTSLTQGVKGLVGSLLGKVPGVGAAADTALGVQHVWVDNMGAGGLGGGLPGRAAGAAEEAGGALAVGNTGAMLSGAGVAIGGALSLGAVAAVAGVAIDQYSKISNQGDALAAQATEFVKTADLPALQRGAAAVETAAKDLMAQSGYNPMAAAATGGVGEAGKIIAAAIVAAENKALAAGAGGMTADRRAALGAQDFGAPGLTAVNELSGGLTAQLKGGRVGETAAALANSITGVFKGSMAPSFVSMSSALKQLRDLQARLLSQGDANSRTLAGSIGSNIKYLSSRVDAVTQAINLKQFTAQYGYGGGAVGGITASPKLGTPSNFAGSDWASKSTPTLHVTTTVSARQNQTANTHQTRWGPTPVAQGAQ